MTGTSNLAKNTNAGQSSLASPISKVFPSPPLSAGLSTETPTLLSSIQDSDNQTNSLNGISPLTMTDTVTVTHFSEKRGTIEKISVSPSLNIFNAEFKADSNNSTTKPSTNPFLNTSPVGVASKKPTNPFHISLTTNSIDHEPISLNTDDLKSNDVISICSENNNDTGTTTLMSKRDTPKAVVTNPFAIAIDEIDNDNHTEKIKTNNNDAFNNFKNNNIVVNDKAEPSVDELNENMKNIEVNSINFQILISQNIRKKIISL